MWSLIGKGLGQPADFTLLLRRGGEWPALELLPGVREPWECAQVAVGRFPALAATKAPLAKSCFADSLQKNGKSE